MKHADRWTLHVSNLLVGGSGLLYAGMKYLMESADPFAVVNHPWQPVMLSGHVVTAPLLVFGVGLLLRTHALPHLRRKSRKGYLTGIGLLGLAVPMIASGYLIQTSVDEGWRTAWIWVHIIASCAWTAIYLGHVFSTYVRPSRSADREFSTSPAEIR